MEKWRFLTLYWNLNGKIFVLVYEKPTQSDLYLHYSSHHQTKCRESFIFSFFNIAYLIIANKGELPKESARKQASVGGEWISRKDCE